MTAPYIPQDHTSVQVGEPVRPHQRLASQRFLQDLAVILGLEGGYGNNPHDRGGPTMNGISTPTHLAYHKEEGTKPEPLQNIDPHEVATIYHENYWEPVGADTLPEPLALGAFDAAVQHGPQRAARMVSGSGGDPERLLGERAARYQSLAKIPSQAGFLGTWMRRLRGIRDAGSRQLDDLLITRP